MSRDILLTGSVGLESAAEVFRTLGRALGTRASRLPDGETGYARRVWIQSQAPFFLGNPAFEQVEPDPDRPGALRPARMPSKGLYSHTAAGRWQGRARLRPGVQPEDVRFDNLGYADWAIESYAIFRLTGCEFCKSFEPLAVVGENSYTRGQCIQNARAKKRGDHAHARPTLCHGVPRIFLTTPLSYDAVALYLGQCEQLLRYGKLATSSVKKPKKMRKGSCHEDLERDGVALAKLVMKEGKKRQVSCPR